jgi:hypothetical protein
MAVMLLMPLVIKAEHHVEDNICREKKVLHFHTYHENCLVCSFNFSVFSTVSFDEKSPIQFHSESYLEDCHSLINTLPNHYSFLLRAPPAFTK